jgi:hypothetical protein
MNLYTKSTLALLLSAATFPLTAIAEAIDASDPTKIYNFFGGGPKYSEFTNGDHILELRVIGNIGLSEHDMVLFEAGYGWYDGVQSPGNNSDYTDARLRWFHLNDMNYDLNRGYRGMGLQVDLQLAGRLKGTDGQNQLHIGVMPVYAISQRWNLYLMANIANAWDKRFEHWNGIGPSVTTQFIYDNNDLWPGMQFRASPGYTYFLAGDLEDEGSGTLELNLGGEVTPTIMWDITYVHQYDKDLKTYRRELSSELNNDWNIYFNVTSYF